MARCLQAVIPRHARTFGFAGMCCVRAAAIATTTGWRHPLNPFHAATAGLKTLMANSAAPVTIADATGTATEIETMTATATETVIAMATETVIAMATAAMGRADPTRRPAVTCRHEADRFGLFARP